MSLPKPNFDNMISQEEADQMNTKLNERFRAVEKQMAKKRNAAKKEHRRKVIEKLKQLHMTCFRARRMLRWNVGLRKPMKKPKRISASKK